MVRIEDPRSEASEAHTADQRAASVSFKEPLALEVGTATLEEMDDSRTNKVALPALSRKKREESSRKKAEEKRRKGQSIAVRGDKSARPPISGGDRKSEETKSKTESRGRKKVAKTGDPKERSVEGAGTGNTGVPPPPDRSGEDARITGLQSATRELKELVRSITKEVNEGEKYEDLMLSTFAKMRIHKITDLWENFAGSGKDSRVVPFFRHWFQDQSEGQLLTPTALRLLRHTGPKQRAYEKRWMELKEKEEKEHKAHQDDAAAQAKKKWEKKREAAAAVRAASPRGKTGKKEEKSNAEDAGPGVP